MRSAARAPEARALERRIASVVVGVVVAAARDARRSRLLVLDGESPEGRLLGRWLDEADTGLALDSGAGLRLHPANKTAALLAPDAFDAPVLPLADLYASQVARLAGDWSAPEDVRDLIDRAGGVEATDAFLMRYLDERRPFENCQDGLAEGGGAALRERLEAGWWWRRRLGVVPKLGSRTIGIDLR